MGESEISSGKSGLPGGLYVAGLVAVGVLAAASIGPSVSGEMLDLSDGERVRENPRTRSLGSIFSTEGRGSYAPLGELTFAADRVIFGEENLAKWLRLHGMLSSVVFAVLATLLAAKMTGSRGGGLVAGAILAAHPLMVEPGAWISARPVLCAGSLLAASGLLYLPGREGPRPGAGRMTGALLFFALAALCHPIAVAWPLMLAVLAAFPAGDDKWTLAVRMRPVSAFLVLGLAFGIVHAVTGPDPWELRELTVPGSTGHVLLRSAAATGRTLVAVVLPMRLSPDYSTGLTVSRLFGAVSIAVAALLAVLAFRLRRRAPELAVFVGWTLATVAPAAALTAGFGGDRYALFAVLAASVLAASLLARLWERAGPGGRLAEGSAVAAVLAALLIASIVASARWRSSANLWRASLAMRPDSPRAHLRLASVCLRRAAEAQKAERNSDAEGCLRQARGYVASAGKRNAAEGPRRLILGMICYRWGPDDYGKATQHLAWVVDREKDLAARGILTPETLAEVNVALGVIYESAYVPMQDDRNLPLAKAQFEQALQSDARNAEAMLGLGRVLNKLGQFEEAAGILEAAAEIEPENPGVHGELGLAYESSLNYEKAEAAYVKAAALLGDALGRAGLAYQAGVDRTKRAILAAKRARRKDDKKRIETALSLFDKGVAQDNLAATVRKRILETKEGTPSASLEIENRELLRAALTNYRRATSWRPDFAAAYQRAGVCAYRLRLFKEAKQLLAAADLYQKRNLVTLYMLARTDLLLGKVDDADGRLRDCISIDRSFGLAHLWLARLLAYYRDKETRDVDLAHSHAVTAASLLGTQEARDLEQDLLKVKRGEIDLDAENPKDASSDAKTKEPGEAQPAAKENK